MVVILSGVTGSGKTTIGRRLAHELGWAFYDADAFHSEASVEKMRRGIPLEDEDRLPWLDGLRALIQAAIARGENAVLACSALKAAYRRRLRVNDDVRLVHLDGDYALIAGRLARRGEHFMNPSLLQSQFDTLERPTPAEALIVDAGLPPDEIVPAIRRDLRL